MHRLPVVPQMLIIYFVCFSDSKLYENELQLNPRYSEHSL